MMVSPGVSRCIAQADAEVEDNVALQADERGGEVVHAEARSVLGGGVEARRGSG